MSFLQDLTEIKDGDLVLAWMTRSNVRPITAKKDQVLNTRYGAFHHDIVIGSKFGSQIPNSSNKGFIHLIAPTPELWSLSLPHRTQIVYTPDSSYIVQRLKIRPGSRVIEAGTGSGSFTHAISRTVGRKGHIFTYEFHEPRFIEAQKEIEDHGLTDVVTITHRDVCNDGFDLDNNNDAPNPVNASAIFLDLPSPWTAIPKLKSVVTTDRVVSICCFSPCMEQVIKTVEALRREGFQRIEMVEVSARKWEGHKDMVRSIDDAVTRLRDVKTRRIQGMEIRSSRAESVGLNKKRKLEESPLPDTVENSPSAENSGTEHSASTADDEDMTPKPSGKIASSSPGIKGFNPWGKGTRVKEGDPNYEWRDISRVETEIKSHTSYLTFAILPPKIEVTLTEHERTDLGELEEQSV